MIQIALDRMGKEECFKIVAQINRYIDYIEIGTGVIKQYGMSIVQEMKERYPEKEILADMKTCDAGKHETHQAFEAGADYTTVMGFSADKTIIDSLQVAEEHRKHIVVDLLGITTKDRILELKEIGVKAVSMHIGKDMQGETSLEILENYQDVLEGFTIFVAGGIDPECVQYFSKLNPNVYIIGSYITGSLNPEQAAKNMQEVIGK
ncbi:3-hexulose-6-phosphate synthase [Virgibacillus salinus]|uniref:3-hexulose-6-phosphate synthase n=1 Tax=Virgibacillus salinus TaxID=553311 RepID=A0A1H0Z027_9BACI|nr:3-hexulose-6-phosphate synthase [Virgibacillus salinus]SDQ20877.1 3-hexulose-6-phosphate synthase [Virgibacillus salinus]